MTDEEVVTDWNVRADFVNGYPANMTYALVPTHTVPSQTRAAAEAGVTTACALLSIPRPKTLWFEAEGPADLDYRQKYGVGDWLHFRYCDTRGIAHRRAQAIGVRADLEPIQALETAAHEVLHLVQEAGRDYQSEDEPAAERFGREIRDAVGWREGARVHFWDGGYPQSGRTLAGVAEFRDRLVTNDGHPKLFVNSGSTISPEWREWHVDLAALAR